MPPTTTDRETYKTNLTAILTAFSALYPDNLRRVFRARPNSSPDSPFAFIDRLTQRSGYDVGTRTTTFDGLSFVLVEKAYDNEEVALRLDQTVDLLVDFLTGYPQMGGTRGVWSTLIVSDEEYDLGDYVAPAVRFTFPDISVQVGRS